MQSGASEVALTGSDAEADGAWRPRRAAKEGAEGAEGGAAVDWGALPLGGLVAGAVHDVRDYGVLCDLDGHPDVVALVSPGQVRGRDRDLIGLAYPAAADPAGALRAARDARLPDAAGGSGRSLIRSIQESPGRQRPLPGRARQRVAGVRARLHRRRRQGGASRTGRAAA